MLPPAAPQAHLWSLEHVPSAWMPFSISSFSTFRPQFRHNFLWGSQEEKCTVVLYSGTYSTSDIRCVGFLPPSNSPASAGCLIIQFNSNANQSYHRPHRLRAQPHRASASTHLRPLSKVQFVICASHQPAVNRSFPGPPPQVQSFAEIAHRTQGNALLVDYYNRGYDKGYR